MESMLFIDQAHFFPRLLCSQAKLVILGKRKSPCFCLGYHILEKNHKAIFLRKTVIAVEYFEISRDFVTIHKALLNLHGSSQLKQDGSRPRRTSAMLDFLQEHFDDRVIALHFMNYT